MGKIRYFDLIFDLFLNFIPHTNNQKWAYVREWLASMTTAT